MKRDIFSYPMFTLYAISLVIPYLHDTGYIDPPYTNGHLQNVRFRIENSRYESSILGNQCYAQLTGIVIVIPKSIHYLKGKCYRSISWLALFGHLLEDDFFFVWSGGKSLSSLIRCLPYPPPSSWLCCFCWKLDWK